MCYFIAGKSLWKKTTPCALLPYAGGAGCTRAFTTPAAGRRNPAMSPSPSPLPRTDTNDVTDWARIYSGDWHSQLTVCKQPFLVFTTESISVTSDEQEQVPEANTQPQFFFYFRSYVKKSLFKNYYQSWNCSLVHSNRWSQRRSPFFSKALNRTLKSAFGVVKMTIQGFMKPKTVWTNLSRSWGSMCSIISMAITASQPMRR